MLTAIEGAGALNAFVHPHRDLAMDSGQGRRCGGIKNPVMTLRCCVCQNRASRTLFFATNGVPSQAAFAEFHL